MTENILHSYLSLFKIFKLVSFKNIFIKKNTAKKKRKKAGEKWSNSMKLNSFYYIYFQYGEIVVELHENLKVKEYSFLEISNCFPLVTYKKKEIEFCLKNVEKKIENCC